VNNGENTTTQDSGGTAEILAHQAAHATDDLASLSSVETTGQLLDHTSGNGPTSPSKKPFTLTTRQLLPYYKLETVHQFMDIFAKGKSLKLFL
jgi:hypothetical protein